MLHTILVPLDGSAFAETALPTAFHLARRDDADVLVVRVHEPALPVTRTRGARVVDPTLDQVLRWNADLVAMATHSRGGVERLLLGSERAAAGVADADEGELPLLARVADKVLRESDRALLLWNPLETES